MTTVVDVVELTVVGVAPAGVPVGITPDRLASVTVTLLEARPAGTDAKCSVAPDDVAALVVRLTIPAPVWMIRFWTITVPDVAPCTWTQFSSVFWTVKFWMTMFVLLFVSTIDELELIVVTVDPSSVTVPVCPGSMPFVMVMGAVDEPDAPTVNISL